MSMLICLNEFAMAARTRKLAGKTYVTISRPFPAAYRRLFLVRVVFFFFFLVEKRKPRAAEWGGGCARRK